MRVYGCHGVFIGVFGFLWVVMSFYVCLGVSVGLWVFVGVMGIYGSLWVSMNVYGFMRVYGCHEYLWVFMGFYECFWVSGCFLGCGFWGVFISWYLSDGIYRFLTVFIDPTHFVFVRYYFLFKYLI